MFDSNEIARRALIRATEISAHRKRARRLLSGSALLLSVCAVVVTLSISWGGTAPNDIEIIDALTPLAEPNTEGVSGVTYPVIGDIYINAGETDIDISLFNPEGNLCVLTFELVLVDTDETLYTSGIVAPSMRIEKITLPRPLEKGEYGVRLITRAFTPDSLAEISAATETFDLIIS